MIYDDPTKEPNRLIPIIDTKILQLKEVEYQRKYVFKIKYSKSSVIFAALNEQDFNEWMREFKNLQNQKEEKRCKAMNFEDIFEKDVGSIRIP